MKRRELSSLVAMAAAASVFSGVPNDSIFSNAEADLDDFLRGRPRKERTGPYGRWAAKHEKKNPTPTTATYEPKQTKRGRRRARHKQQNQ